MVLPGSVQIESQFLSLHMPVLLKKFSLTYKKDYSCIEYFLYSNDRLRKISRTLIVSHEIVSDSLYVSKFYPEIYKELNCKYLSAACFYLMAHHAAKLFHLHDNCCVTLETESTVFDTFYSRLNEFDFKIRYSRPANRLCLKGRYHELPFSTAVIKQAGKTDSTLV